MIICISPNVANQKADSRLFAGECIPMTGVVLSKSATGNICRSVSSEPVPKNQAHFYRKTMPTKMARFFCVSGVRHNK